MFAAIELVQRVNQAHYPGVHQVLERDMARQALVNPPRDVAHLRQLFQQQAFTLIIVLPAGIGAMARFGHAVSVRILV